MLKANGIQISMDGKGSRRTAWKSVKYEEVYLRKESVPERTGLGGTSFAKV